MLRLRQRTGDTGVPSTLPPPGTFCSTARRNVLSSYDSLQVELADEIGRRSASTSGRSLWQREVWPLFAQNGHGTLLRCHLLPCSSAPLPFSRPGARHAMRVSGGPARGCTMCVVRRARSCVVRTASVLRATYVTSTARRRHRGGGRQGRSGKALRRSGQPRHVTDNATSFDVYMEITCALHLSDGLAKRAVLAAPLYA